LPHTPEVLKQIFKKRGIVLNKKYGQHILIDQNILSYIAETAALRDSDVVLEIGTGTGSLTRFLAEKAGYVFTIEIDKQLFDLSSEILRYYQNITIINADILQSKHRLNPQLTASVEDWLNRNNKKQIKVVSNLPYNISTPVIVNLLESSLPISIMVLMLQKDITERLTALPGTKEYGILSVISQLFAEVEVVRTLSPHVFWPQPEVYSAIVKMAVCKDKYAHQITDYSFFLKIVFSIFTTRRKTIRKSLEYLKSCGISKSALKEILKSMQLDEDIRGEILNLDQLIKLTEELYKLSERYRVNRQYGSA